MKAQLRRIVDDPTKSVKELQNTLKFAQEEIERKLQAEGMDATRIAKFKRVEGATKESLRYRA